MMLSMKVGDGEPERFKTGREVKALLSDLNRRLGLPADSHLSYGQLGDCISQYYHIQDRVAEWLSHSTVSKRSRVRIPVPPK